jgi:hypothetical protein
MGKLEQAYANGRIDREKDDHRDFNPIGDIICGLPNHNPPSNSNERAMYDRGYSKK